MESAASLRRQYRASAAAYREAAKPRKTDWGLFVWRGDGRYWRAGAVKVYKTQSGAEKAASRLYDEDRDSAIVARPIFD